MGLMAVQIQREVFDLARKHAGMQGVERECRVDEAAQLDESHELIPIERWEEFHAAVEAPPGDPREVFRMVWYLGLDRDAAAKAMGCSARTLGRMWADAREQAGRSLASTS